MLVVTGATGWRFAISYATNSVNGPAFRANVEVGVDPGEELSPGTVNGYVCLVGCLQEAAMTLV